MFGLGFWELLIVSVIGAVFLAVPTVVIILVIRLSQSSGNERLAQLEEENNRLRKLLAENGISHNGAALPKK